MPNAPNAVLNSSSSSNSTITHTNTHDLHATVVSVAHRRFLLPIRISLTHNTYRAIVSLVMNFVFWFHTDWSKPYWKKHIHCLLELILIVCFHSTTDSEFSEIKKLFFNWNRHRKLFYFPAMPFDLRECILLSNES